MALLPQTQIILDKFAQSSIEQMKKNASSYRASGTMEKGFTYLLNNRGLTIFGVNYLQYFEQGRGKTKNSTPSKPTLAESLVSWIAFKGIPLWRDAKGRFMSRKTMAFLIARKIHREGVSWHKKTPRDIYSSVFTKESVDKLTNQITEYEETTITSEIRRLLKNIRNQ